jgi:hypothetical protein
VTCSPAPGHAEPFEADSAAPIARSASPRSQKGGPAVGDRPKWLDWCLVVRGEMRKALGRGEEGLHIAEDVDQAHTLVAAGFGLGLLRLRRGESAEAMAMD